MSVDALAKRFFPGIILALIALAAYFQASGIMQLVAGAYLARAPAAEDKSAPKAPPPIVPSESSGPKSAEPILARNPFDSVAGPLNKAPEVEEGTTQPKQELDLSNPLT